MTTAARTPKNTTAFYAQAALSFGVALFAVGLAIINLPADPWARAFLALGSLYLVTSTFTLAKCVRDAQENGTVISRLDEARLERMLAEFDPYAPPSTAVFGAPQRAGSSPLAPFPGPAAPAPQGEPAAA
jgi:hypothetical protein